MRKSTAVVDMAGMSTGEASMWRSPMLRTNIRGVLSVTEETHRRYQD